MHKPFNLEAAKRGEPVEYLGLGDRWELCRFLGVSESGDGYLVIERVNGGGFQLAYATPADLRMAAKKLTVRYRIYTWKDDSGNIRPGIIDPIRAEGSSPEMGGAFVEWIHTEWQEAEVDNRIKQGEKQ